MARDMLVLPQLYDLITDRQIEQWHFPPESVEMIKGIIADIESGTYMV